MSQKKPIKFITPFTTVDYPDHLACIVWFSRCNMRCKYCYNADIVLQNGEISVDELMKFLQKRAGLLDGVVLSGGECTLYGGLYELCQEIKKLGFKIKLDTNGTNPVLLKRLCEDGLVDFVALDYKAPKEKFSFVARAGNVLYEKFEQSLDMLISLDFPFEARTTLHEDLLSEKDIESIAQSLHHKNYKHSLYLQHFLDVPNMDNLSSSMKVFEPSKIKSKVPIGLRNF